MAKLFDEYEEEILRDVKEQIRQQDLELLQEAKALLVYYPLMKRLTGK